VLDKERTLRLDPYAVVQFKKLTRAEGLGPLDQWGRPAGIDITSGFSADMVDIETMPLFLAACLVHEDKRIDGDLVSRHLTTEILEKISAALSRLSAQFFAFTET